MFQFLNTKFGTSVSPRDIDSTVEIWKVVYERNKVMIVVPVFSSTKGTQRDLQRQYERNIMGKVGMSARLRVWNCSNVGDLLAHNTNQTTQDVIIKHKANNINHIVLA